MILMLKHGLSVVYRRSLLVIILFLYEMFWGFILYRFVRSIIVPLLYRYPGEDLESWSYLFWIEGEFRLLKTGLALSTALILLAFLIGRMLLTPLINAGVFHAIHHIKSDQWKSFLVGIRSYWGRFTILYLIQMIVTLAPLYWLISPVIPRILDGTWQQMNLTLIGLYAAMYLVNLSLVRLCFMYLQFAIISGVSLWSALQLWLSKLLVPVGLSALILLMTIISQSILASASLYWAGLSALIIYQATPLMRVFFQMWEIATQHHVWLQNR